MKNKNVFIVVLIFAVSLSFLLVPRLFSQRPLPQPQPSAAASGHTPPQMSATSAAQHAASSPASANPSVFLPAAVPTLVPAAAYMGIQIGDVIYDPYPLTEEKDFEILQKDGKRNVVRLTADSIHILTANCANQDCIRQGLVSLANRDQRVLQNQIICLPNKVLLTLLTPQEAQTQWANLYAAGYSK